MQAPTIINLTGMTIKVAELHEKGHADPTKVRRTITANGREARVVQPTRESLLEGITVLRRAEPRVVGLPEAMDAVFLVVPQNVLPLCPKRTDLLAAGNCYKDPMDANAVLCTHFVGHATD